MMQTATASTTIATDPVRDDHARPTRIAVDQVDGRARISTLDHGAFMAARPLGISGNRVRVALIGKHMSLLGGDIIDLRIDVGQGVVLEVVEPVGTVAYNAEGRRSDWRLEASVADGATLIWHGNQFVAAQGSNAHRATRLSLGSQARALLKETLVLGRSGEFAERLRNRTHVSRQQQELLVEDLDLGTETRRAPGIVGSSRAISTVAAAGWRPDGESADAHRFDLANPGALYRALDDATHHAEDIVAPVFEEWSSQLSGSGCRAGVVASA